MSPAPPARRRPSPPAPEPPGCFAVRWREALAAARLAPEERWRYATEIQRFLRYCLVLQVPSTARHAREYLGIVPLLSARPFARRALRWYFRAALRPLPPRPAPAPVPPYLEFPPGGDQDWPDDREAGGDDGEDDAEEDHGGRLVGSG